MIMNATSSWKRVPLACALALGLGTVASMTTNEAIAGCSLYDPVMPLAQLGTHEPGGARLMEAVYRPRSGGFIPVGNTSAPNNGIVGLWTVSFVSDGVPPNPVPAGVETDFG